MLKKCVSEKFVEECYVVSCHSVIFALNLQYFEKLKDQQCMSQPDVIRATCTVQLGSNARKIKTFIRAFSNVLG